MKAIVHSKYGSPEVLKLQEVEKPIPKDNEICVRIIASTVNRTDTGYLQGKPAIVRLFSGLFSPKQQTLGNELSGIVESTGKGVKTFKKGDEVYGINCWQFGTHAEYVCMPETNSIFLKPVNYSFETAVALGDGPFLSYATIKVLNIKKGDKILINGASGSIGSSAVQLAKYFGAEITAVCGTKNMELVKSLGATKVIDYQKDDFTKLNDTFDFVYDAVGKSSFFRCKKLLKPNGIYVSTELGFLCQNPFLALWSNFFGKKKVIFPIPKDSKEMMVFFKLLAEEGHLKPVVDREYSLEQIKEAYKYVLMEQKTGSVVIRVQ